MTVKKPQERKTGPIWGTVDWLTDGLGRIRGWQDDLNPNIRSVLSAGSSVAFLLGGAYFGPEIRVGIDEIMTTLGGVVITPASIRTTLIGLTLALVTYQVWVVKEIRNNSNGQSPRRKTDGGEQKDPEEPDSGEKEREFKTDGKGALTGAIAGASIGSLFGPGGVIGGLLGGLILGDEIQRRQEERRRKAREEITPGLVDGQGNQLHITANKDEEGDDT